MKIRKGNSFEILYTAMIADEKVDLETVQGLQVFLSYGYRGVNIPVEHVFEDGSIRVKVGNQLGVGDYRLLVGFTYNESSIVRDPRVFTIVEHVENEVPGSACGCVEVLTIPVSDNVNSLGLPGINGKSAYELWLQQGHTGSIDDFLDWLKMHFGELTEGEIAILQGPAIAAAQAVTEQMEGITTDYNTLKQNAEQTIQQTNTAKQEANTARDAANTAAWQANTARDAANTAAGNANGKASLANEKAGLANDAAQRAEAAAAAITKNWIVEW